MICCTKQRSNLNHIHDQKYITKKYISYNSLQEKKKLGMTTLKLLYREQQLNLINLKIRWRNDDKRTQFTVS